MDSNEFKEAIALLEKEKGVSREVILNAIREAMLTACNKSYGNIENIDVTVDYDSCEFHIIRSREVVDEVMDPALEIELEDAREIDPHYEIGDIVKTDIPSMEFGRIAASSAKNVMLQLIHEEERKNVLSEYSKLEKTVVTGIVQRIMGKSIVINLGKADGTLSEREQIKNERLHPNDRVKVYIVEVKDNKKGPKIFVSRSHPELVRKLFEEEVSEVRDGIVTIRSIAREPGNRTKIAVWSEDPNVDPVGACVGMNGSRVNEIVKELRNEKIDIVNWDENPAKLIENSLSPAKVISVIADSEEKTASVVVPDYQLSLAIGKEGQNARLAAKLTGFKIDIKSETQAQEAGWFDNYDEYYEEDEYYEDGYYDEDGNFVEYSEHEEYEENGEGASEEVFEEEQPQDSVSEAEEALEMTENDSEETDESYVEDGASENE